MSYITSPKVAFLDGPDKDAFGRLRTSDPVTLFASQFQYDAQPLLWESALVGTGSVTHLPNESSIQMRVAASGDSVIRQSRVYTRYKPGKSLLVALTFVMGAGVTNVRKRLGYFDANNGIYLEQDGTAVSIVRRTYTSGSAVNNAVLQAAWNIDKFDGTGPSGITLDLSKAQILMMDLQWLGVGRVRVGFDIDGVFWPAHQFLNANNLTTVYMTTANLPLRYELVATDTIGGNVDLIQICSMVTSEGGFETDFGFPRSVANGVVPISVTTRRPVLTIRPKLTFNSITNRGLIIPEEASLTAATNNAYWELVYNGVVATPAWTNVGTNSIAEVDIASTTITGGEVIASGYVLSGGFGSRLQIDNSITTRYPLSLDIAGTGFITLSLVCTSFTGTSSITGELSWRELV